MPAKGKMPKATRVRREFLHHKCRRMGLLNNRYEFVQMMPFLLEEANIPVPSRKTRYNDWDWIMKQELDVSHRRDEASRLITMAEDMAMNNEDPGTLLRAAELIFKHADPYTEAGGGRLKDGLNATADLANSFGTDPPPAAEPPEEVQEWMDEMRERDGES